MQCAAPSCLHGARRGRGAIAAPGGRTARERAPGSRAARAPTGSTTLRSAATAGTPRRRLRARALVLDDTVAVRADAPDVLSSARPRSRSPASSRTGACGPPSDAAALVELSCLKYRVPRGRCADAAEAARDAAHGDRGAAGADGSGAGTAVPWFNSGVVALSWHHAALLAPLAATAAAAAGGDRGASGVPLAWDASSSDGGGGEALLDPELLWDQGYLNAERLRRGVPLANLGYAFNYLGSFETDNKARAPQLGARGGARDAFLVQAARRACAGTPPPASRTAALVAAWEADAPH